jgi:hypothetical protein
MCGWRFRQDTSKPLYKTIGEVTEDILLARQDKRRGTLWMLIKQRIDLSKTSIEIQYWNCSMTINAEVNERYLI